MKKSLLYISMSLSLALASNFEKNVENLLNDYTKSNEKIFFYENIKLDKNIRLVVVSNKEKNDNQKKTVIPLITNDNGDMLIAITPLFSFKNKEIEKKFTEIIAKYWDTQDDENKRVSSQKNIISDIEKTNAFLTFKGNNASKKILYVFSDPNCPYCREAISNLKRDLSMYREIKILPVGVINEKSALKSSDIIEFFKKEKDLNLRNKKLLEVYSNSYAPKSTTPSQEVIKNTKIMLDYNINSVPYKIEMTID